ncbi:hypothetical protein F2Q70_00021371 [Brassica cretica]|uniref:Uncharacterized protein n=1 Tax=Brassica cretica TaxID=69181 RepID=A0A8S9GQC8_BRACR|nr:hypothetical protein F2Q70_00021371 [Brassica cretica]
MDGVPDLSALLKGKLQLISKKSTPANVQGSTSSDGGGASKERAPGLVDEGVGAEPSASNPKKKKKSRKAKRKATDEVPLDETASLDETSEGLEARKKKGGRKRPYEGATSSVDQEEAPTVRYRGSRRDRPVRGGASGSSQKEEEEEVAFLPKLLWRRRERSQREGVVLGVILLRARGLLLIRLRDKALVLKLGSSEKLGQARLKAIERVRAEHKKANEKAAKEKEILRVKFEELEGKLKSARAAKKQLARENIPLEQAAVTLEKEKTELLEESCFEKANRCLGRVRDHFTRLDAFGKAKNLYGQALGTKKCLEMIRASGTEIPQEMIDVFVEQEKLHEAEATKLCVCPLSDSDLTLSPLVLPSRFVEDRFRASFDPYGSNVNLIRAETASQLITSLEITEEPSEEPLVDVMSVPAEHVEVPEGGGLDERPENENLEETLLLYD